MARKPANEAAAESVAVPVETSASENTTLVEKPKRKYTKRKKDELVLSTIVQIGDTEIDITDIAAKAYKAYKSVHRRKIVKEFRVYVKPEENAAYYTVNGEGAADFKIDL